VQASLGLIPLSALAFGVQVDGYDVTLCFQLRELSEEDVLDMDDIVSELEALLGNRVRVSRAHEIRIERRSRAGRSR
jgi:hypothetical protein